MTDEIQAPTPAEQPVIEQTEGAPLPPDPVEPKAEAKAESTRMDSIEKAFKSLGEEAGEKEAKPDDRPRNPDGTFAAKDLAGEKPVEKPKEEAKPVEVKDEPPSRFSPEAKAAWKDVPDPVRHEFRRAMTEMQNGIQQKDEQLAPLKPYFEMAKQHGVELAPTLGNYVRMEQLLAKDMRQGLEAIAQNLGMTFDDMIAKATGGQSQSTDKDREIIELKQTVQALQEQVGGVTQHVRQSYESDVMRQIETFAADKPAFDYLQNDIAARLQDDPNITLEQAYDDALAHAQQMMAVLNPQPQPAPTPQPRPARSVTGAPSAGSNPGQRAPSANRSEAVMRAFGAVGLS